MEEFKAPATTYADPEKPGTLSATNILPWQENLSAEGHVNLGNQVNDVSGIIDRGEGRSSAGAASDAIFNMAKTPGMSSALSSRASKMMGLNKTQNDFDLKSKNVMRQQREMQRLGHELNNVERLKTLNYQGQLRYADQIADYNDKLQAAKYEILGGIVSSAGSFYGGMLGQGMHKMGTQRDQLRADAGGKGDFNSSINAGSLA